MTLTLTIDESKLAELHALYERCGRPWHGDEFMALWLFRRGLHEELDDARFIAEIYKETRDANPT
jgi:hypothetical protein